MNDNLLSNILEELEDYGKYKGVLIIDDDIYIPVLAAKMIVRKNVEGVRYDWNDEK